MLSKRFKRPLISVNFSNDLSMTVDVVNIILDLNGHVKMLFELETGQVFI